MASLNHTSFSHTVFILVGIPGLEDQHMWISIPFLISYITAIMGNSLLIYLIVTERTLHEPMYFFLSMLASADIVFSTTAVPKSLSIFWFNDREISLGECITQLFFIHSTYVTESGLLLVMAFDHYIAICYPLRYNMILTNFVTGNIGLAVLLRSIGIIFPIIFLLTRLTFCRNNILPHTCCEHIGLAKYACGDIRANIWYGLFVLLSTVVLDIILIAISYGLLLQAVFHIPSKNAHHKALNTCGSHVCVIALFYVPGIFTIPIQRFGHNIPSHVHILLANVCALVPPMLNPIIYGVRTKQIRDRFLYVFFPREKWLWRMCPRRIIFQMLSRQD
ncbi:olfactory receptor 52B4-like [Notamacropus eugenii]|uniref:olfactory receptor 52B4-like n=1 Tax=Notamacropus eugenii TaxID=9315 RepID=UPI003B6856CE